MTSLLERFNPNRLADLLESHGWSCEDEVRTLINIAQQDEVKALPSALAAIKMLHDRTVESLQLSGLIQKVQGHIQGTTPSGQQAQMTTTGYQLGSHTDEMLAKAYGAVRPALPLIEGEVQDELCTPPVGEHGVCESGPDRGPGMEQAPQDGSPGLVVPAGGRNRESASGPEGETESAQSKKPEGPEGPEESQDPVTAKPRRAAGKSRKPVPRREHKQQYGTAPPRINLRGTGGTDTSGPGTA